MHRLKQRSNYIFLISTIFILLQACSSDKGSNSIELPKQQLNKRQQEIQEQLTKVEQELALLDPIVDEARKNAANEFIEFRKIVQRFQTNRRGFEHIDGWGSLAVKETIRLPDTPYIVKNGVGGEYLTKVTKFLSDYVDKDQHTPSSTLSKVLADYVCPKHQTIVRKKMSYKPQTRTKQGLHENLYLPNLSLTVNDDKKLKAFCEAQRKLSGIAVPLPTIGASLDASIEDHDAFVTEFQQLAEKRETEEGLSELETARYKELKSKIHEEVTLNRLWVTQQGIYADPISYLIDQDVPLVSGNSQKEAAVWWNQLMLPDALRFYPTVLNGYHDMLKKKLFPRFDQRPTGALLSEMWSSNENSFEECKARGYSECEDIAKQKFDINNPGDSYVKLIRTDHQGRTFVQSWSDFFSITDGGYQNRIRPANVSMAGQSQLINESFRRLLPIFAEIPEDDPDKKRAESLSKAENIMSEVVYQLIEHTRHMSFDYKHDELTSMYDKVANFVATIPLESHAINDELKRIGAETRAFVHNRTWTNVESRGKLIREKLSEMTGLVRGGVAYADLSDVSKDEVTDADRSIYEEELSEKDRATYFAFKYYQQFEKILIETNQYYFNYVYTGELFTPVPTGH